MAEFIYLYRGGGRPETPEQGEQVMQKWADWMQGLGAQLKDRGQPLEPSGKVVSGKNKDVSDGPFVETKDLVGGFSIVEASSLDQAAELSKGCPIFERGGSVEVRPVMSM